VRHVRESLNGFKVDQPPGERKRCRVRVDDLNQVWHLARLLRMSLRRVRRA